MSVAAVLWDADGVLQHVPDGWEESMRPAVEGRVDDVEAFLSEAFWEERPALRGEVRWTERLPALLGEWGIAESLDEVVDVWLSIEAVPQTQELVREVRRAGTTCCLATNQDERRARRMEELFDYSAMFDRTYYSCDLGAAKPEAAYFEKIAASLATPPASLLFFDDNAGNVEAARESGLQAELWSYREDLDVLRGHLTRHGVPLTDIPW